LRAPWAAHNHQNNGKHKYNGEEAHSYQEDLGDKATGVRNRVRAKDKHA
jgi:hypothetical protein